jgi:hypothetical protein
MSWRLRVAIGLLVLLAGTGCQYTRDRVYDLSDVVDVRVGLAYGAGAKLEATRWHAVGLGYAWQPWTWEWFGRRAIEREQLFLHMGFGGWEVRSAHGAEHDRLYALTVDILQLTRDAHDYGGVRERFPDEVILPGWQPPWPRFIDRFRFGGHVMLGVDFGLYLNCGQLYDFLAGLFGYDPAEDDGLTKLQADWPGDL